MIKSVVISISLPYLGRLIDGLVLCETNEGFSEQDIQKMKYKVKQYHREITSHSKQADSPLKQIQYPNYGIFYKTHSYITYTMIVESRYPLKLVNSFIQTIITAFMDELKCILGATGYISRLQSIQGSHYFIKFDRVIKQKKKQYDDPSSLKNMDRMKKQLENIHSIIKENMKIIDEREKKLLNTQVKAKLLNQESKKFHSSTKKLVWHLWVRKNIIWVIIAFVIIILLFVFVW